MRPTQELETPARPDGVRSGGRCPWVIVEPAGAWTALNLREIWAYRDLLLILASRDVKLRYKQTALGVFWVILQPLTAALIFAVVFGYFGRLPSDGAPYLVFVFAGLIPWSLFSGALQRAGNSLIADSKLISKVYFPRLLVPLASTLAVVVDTLVSLLVLAVLMGIYGILPGWRLLTLPVFLALALVAAVGTSLWLSALNVRYRDFMYAMPFVIQVWMYASPVVYATNLIDQRWHWLYGLNPAVMFIEGVRWAIFGQSALTAAVLATGLLVTFALLVSGMVFFQRVEQSFADVI